MIRIKLQNLEIQSIGILQHHRQDEVQLLRSDWKAKKGACDLFQKTSSIELPEAFDKVALALDRDKDLSKNGL